MRIHQIITDYSMYTGGAQRVVRALHLGLRSRGIESNVLGLMQQQDEEVENAQSLCLKDPYKFRALNGIYRYIKANVRPNDIVHVHLFPPLLHVSLSQIMAHIPCHLVCTEHSTSNRRRGTAFGRMVDILTYAGYEQVVAISKGVEQELIKWKPSLKGKTRVIHNGVHLSFEKMIERRDKLRLKVLSVGNLRPMKNYDRALEAVALLRDLDFEYCIAGMGECQEHLLQLRQELGLESKVHFLGYIASIPNLLAGADIFLMPSKWEGFGLSAVEAMNASLPLVASNVPGLREIVNGGPPCALLIDPESPQAIAAGLRKLLVNPALRVQFGEIAFKRAQNFSINSMVDSYINLYDELL